MQAKTILVVDDDDSIREMMRMALELEGYQVVTSANGQEALQKLREGLTPCLILLDLMMPVMNGWEFLASVKTDERLRRIRVALVTAYIELTENIGDREVIRKPIDLAHLQNVITRICGQA